MNNILHSAALNQIIVMFLAVLSIMLKSYLLTTAVCIVTAVLEYLRKDEL